ncbi:O-antigen ligase family protein [Altererythrobacter sp.]|uniref:O-antigen ligase family protein n=1 Tax=Altererythrobacter sp. TaxID=1872480 RepID=UPI003D083A0D
MIAGGGGVAYGFANLAVQLCALAVLALNREAFKGFWHDAPRPLAIVLAATLALPLLQLVPLPPGAWHSLPGRELAEAARQAAAADGWYALTLDRNRTLVAATGLIAPLAVLTIAWNLPRRDLAWLGWLIVGLGLANFLLGAVQVLSSGQSGLLYPENPMPGVLFGSFANRNSTGIFLVTCLALLVALPQPWRGGLGTAFKIGAGAALAIGVVLTQSRTAMVLVALPVLLAAIRLALRRQAMDKRGLAAICAALALVSLGTLSVMSLADTRLDTSLARFSQSDEARFSLWEDASYTAQKYWPAGAGMGTFDEVFQADESLENLTERRAGRAHNDYLELAIEAGLPGLLLLAGWLALVAWLTFAARRSELRWQAWSGSAILAAVALQSLVDYPLRNQAMLCIVAFALALLGSARRSEEAQQS